MFYANECGLWAGKHAYLWRNMLDNLSDGILITDAEGNVLIYNQAWLELGVAGGGIQIPEGVMNVYNFPKMHQNKKVMAVRVLESGKTCVDIFQTPGKRVLISKGQPIFNEEGNLRFVTVNIRDLSAILSLRDTENNAQQIRKLYNKYIKEAEKNTATVPVVINPKMAALYEKCLTVSSVVPDLKKATEEDWGTEYLDLIASVRTVSSVDEAIEHINRYNTGHSEAIVTKDYANARKFLDEVDAAAVYVNASTRFTDGFEFGFGAEIGISTQKLHARGPMGLKELTTTKYVIYGDGQIRE